MKRVGILGGTFDPIHLGHLILAKEAKEKCKLDEIWFMPAKTPPHKLNKIVSDFSVRKDMIELAIKDHKGFIARILRILWKEIHIPLIHLKSLKEDLQVMIFILSWERIPFMR